MHALFVLSLFKGAVGLVVLRATITLVVSQFTWIFILCCLHDCANSFFSLPYVKCSLALSKTELAV